MEMSYTEKNNLGIAVQHEVAKQSEPPGSSELPNHERKSCAKEKRKKKGRKNQPWTKEERSVLWECFVKCGRLQR